MIVEIPDEDSVIKWKYADNEDWKYAEISDLIKAYERPQGVWVDTGFENEYWAEEFECSLCHTKDHWHNFCPNCGARMTKGDQK